MTGLLQRSRNCRVVLAKRWVVGSFLTTNIHRRFSLRFECLSLSLRTTTGTRMTSSTLVQAQRDAALNPVSRFNTEIVFSFDNLSFWRSVSLKITSSTRTSGLKKLQRRSHHSSSVSWYPAISMLYLHYISFSCKTILKSIKGKLYNLYKSY